MIEHDTKVTATPTEMLAGVIQAIGQVVRGARVVPEVAEARLAICMECEHLILEKKRCSLCGCFMQTKTYIAKASCPDDPKRWDAIPLPSRRR